MTSPRAIPAVVIGVLLSLVLTDGAAASRALHYSQPAMAPAVLSHAAGVPADDVTGTILGLAPNLVSYQGRLTDPTKGGPVPDGKYAMTFSIYDAATGGAPLWTETYSGGDAVPVSGGLFTVLLGSRTPFDASLFKAPGRWLEIRVEGDVLPGRQQMVSVPFALSAENAATLDGAARGDFASVGHDHDARYVNVDGDRMQATKSDSLLAVLNDGTGLSSYGITGISKGSIGVFGASGAGSGLVGISGLTGVYGNGQDTGVSGSGRTVGVRGLGTQEDSIGGSFFGQDTGVRAEVPASPPAGGTGIWAGAPTGVAIEARGAEGIHAFGDGIGVHAMGGEYGVLASGPTGVSAIGGDIGVSAAGSEVGLSAKGSTAANLDGGNMGLYSMTHCATSTELVQYTGVWGDASCSTNGIGVRGEGGAFGVLGGGPIGVQGSGEETGVKGRSAPTGTGSYAVGVHGLVDPSNILTVGVLGESAAGTGVKGDGHTGVFGHGVSYGISGVGSTAGVRGYSESGPGISGESLDAESPGVYGRGANDQGPDLVLGGNTATSDNGTIATEARFLSSDMFLYSNDEVNIHLDNNNDEGSNLRIFNGADQELFRVDENGNTWAKGTKSTVVQTPGQGARSLYAIESPEVWFEDFGTAQLHNGAAVVAIDTIFADTANLAAGYHVFLTPVDGWAPVYVASKTETGFAIRTGDGTANIAVDYRIVAKRRAFEALRLEPVAVTGPDE
jgi:hypothetical protein